MNKFLNYSRYALAILSAVSCMSCAQTSASKVNSDVVKIDRKLVRESVLFDDGAKSGAVVPEISSPRLRATWVPEKIEDNRLIEAHREWTLEGDVAILGIPQESFKNKGAKKK